MPNTIKSINDLFNLNLIYNDKYNYSLPKKVLEDFLSGQAFDHPKPYTPDESQRLREDISALYQRILAENPLKEKIAIITAGSPGAGKTFKLRQVREEQILAGKNIAYICPDDVCLKNQTKSYLADIQQGDQSKEVRLGAYNTWRPGSNAAAHLILAKIILLELAFFLGSTSTSPMTGKSFEFLKKQGYTIRLIHVSSTSKVGWESIAERDKTFVQTTEQDVKEKSLLFPQRINDTYLKYADEIDFCYRADVKQDAKLAAKWIRNKEGNGTLGTLQIIDKKRYEQIKTVHNEGAKILLRPDLYWENTVEASSVIQQPAKKSLHNLMKRVFCFSKCC